eukprot:g14489.t2
MQRGRRDKNDVFVGNIPFGTTEEQLHQIFSEAGGVVSIRLVLDFETGRPKGFAFVEYEDAATALSAIRNLNGYECNNRPLRVNFSNNSSLGAEQQRGEKAPQQVAEALLHMQVRLGMLKADDVPSLQAPPAPAVVGGAIMLGTGAPLPQLVSGQFQQPNTNLAPSANPALGWGHAVPQPMHTQQPPPPQQQLPLQPQQQQMPLIQPSQNSWGAGAKAPTDPRARYNR